MSLSPRQKQIAVHVCKGSADKQIADDLGISYGTVRFHLNTMMGKLKVHSRAALAATFSASMVKAATN